MPDSRCTCMSRPVAVGRSRVAGAGAVGPKGTDSGASPHRVDTAQGIRNAGECGHTATAHTAVGTQGHTRH
eukprot:5334152-Prymnesium_polylepis.1